MKSDCEPNIDFFPQGMEKFFPGLIALTFGNTQLLSVTAEDLQSFPGLAMLSVFVGNLTVIDANLVEFNPNVVRIYFTNNLLENVGNNVFANLTRLYFLDMRGNPCTGHSTQLPDLC